MIQQRGALGQQPAGVGHSAALNEVEARELVTADGVRLHYEVTGPPTGEVLVLANGLGGKLYAWEPLLERFAGTHRCVTWDYRGLFRSSAPASRKALSIAHHAADALALLDQERIERATFVGWSMGVQVSLETALEHPDRVSRLVLLNGTHGQVFQGGLQPLVRLPRFPGLLHTLAERLARRETLVVRGLERLVTSEVHLRAVGSVLSLLYGQPRIGDMYRQYLEDVFGHSFTNYIRLFQALDAHSVYHLLPEVRQPTLVVSGALDWLTPASMSRAIARRIPGAEHLHLPLGSHFALLEYPERVLTRLEEFLART